jgi:hypothetical protein
MCSVRNTSSSHRSATSSKPFETARSWSSSS